MLEGEGRQELLSDLHKGLKQVSTGVRKSRKEMVVGPGNVVTVGELSERKIDPTWTIRHRVTIYDYYNFGASYVPDQAEVELEVAEGIASHRTERVERAMSPAREIVVVEDPHVGSGLSYREWMEEESQLQAAARLIESATSQAPVEPSGQ